MKRISLIVFSVLFAGVCDAAQFTKEDGCKATVNGSVQALETVQEKSGKTESLHGLTIAEINRIVAEQGVCAASQAINDRLYSQPSKL